MADRLADQDLQYSPNESLLKTASDLKEEKQTIRERIGKLEASRKEVSEAVYQRVRSDYLTRLDGVEKKFQALKAELDQELVTLTEKKLTIDSRLKQHREKMEEAKLRLSLGEYTEDQFKKISQEEQAEVKRLEGGQTGILASLARFEEVLKGEEEKLVAKPTPDVPLKPPAPPSPKPEVVHKSSPMESTSKVVLNEKPVTGRPVTAQLQMMEDGKVTQKIMIDKNLRIGRSPANDIVLHDAKVSRQHAEVQIVGGRFVIVDLESSNGTFVGGKKIAEHTLNPGDEIRIGKTTFVFKS